MEFKSQVYTTIEQSKRLIALGIKAETADCCHYYVAGMDDKDIPEDANCPAWSLHRLMELIPIDFRESYFSLSQQDVGYSTGAHEWTYFKEGNVYDCMIDCIEWLIKEGGIIQEYMEEKQCEK